MSSDRPARRIRSGHATLTAHGEPWVWLTAASLAIAIAMIVGLLAFIAFRGLNTFWPVPMDVESRLMSDPDVPTVSPVRCADPPEVLT